MQEVPAVQLLIAKAFTERQPCTGSEQSEHSMALAYAYMAVNKIHEIRSRVSAGAEKKRRAQS